VSEANDGISNFSLCFEFGSHGVSDIRLYTRLYLLGFLQLARQFGSDRGERLHL
jgi:hypothetical protein